MKLVNRTEGARLEKIHRLIDKEHRFASNLQNKVIERTTKTLKERRALLQLLENDYKVERFITMKQDFDPSLINDKANARRYIIESRVFNSGFNMKAMRPEVHRRIRKLDPNHKYKAFKKKLLAKYKELNVEINRGISDATFYKMLSDREHWREFNVPTRKENWETSGESRDLHAVTQDVHDSEEAGAEKDEIEAVRQENVDAEVREKEKSVVLERRLARPKQDAFSMTMRTLGPVYFQTTVNELPPVPS